MIIADIENGSGAAESKVRYRSISCAAYNGEALRDGRLVPVLPGWQVPALSVNAVYPPNRFLPAKTRGFIDHLAARFGPAPYWDAR